jgi:hypothetical protein
MLRAHSCSAHLDLRLLCGFSVSDPPSELNYFRINRCECTVSPIRPRCASLASTQLTPMYSPLHRRVDDLWALRHRLSLRKE